MTLLGRVIDCSQKSRIERNIGTSRFARFVYKRDGDQDIAFGECFLNVRVSYDFAMLSWARKSLSVFGFYFGPKAKDFSSLAYGIVHSFCRSYTPGQIREPDAPKRSGIFSSTSTPI